MNFFDIILIQPFTNALVFFYTQLQAMNISNALGWSIVLLTIVIRFAIYPIMQQSLHQQKKMQLVAPKIAKIKEKYKNDTQAQQMAQIALFKEEKINPASGCLLMLVQIPIIFALYQVLLNVITADKVDMINRFMYIDGLKLTELWERSFFGISLAIKPQEMMANTAVLAISVAVITGILQLIQSKMMTPKAADKPKPKTNGEPDFATTLQTQMLYMMPIMVGFFAFTFPIGISLYWNTFTIFGIIQQYLVQGWGGLVDWFPFLDKKPVSKFK